MSLPVHLKAQIREGLKKVTSDRIGFVRWMIRIHKGA